MTLFNPSTESPAANDTAEKVLAHIALLLHNLYKGIEYQEARGTQLDSGLAPLIDVSFIQAADGTNRMLIRAALEVDPTYVTDQSAKLWNFADRKSVV